MILYNLGLLIIRSYNLEDINSKIICVSAFRSRRLYYKRILLTRTFYERNKKIRLNLILGLQLKQVNNSI